MPFAQRLTCTIDDACEVTGLGRTKLYELIGAGRIVTTTIVRSSPLREEILLVGKVAMSEPSRAFVLNPASVLEFPAYGPPALTGKASCVFPRHLTPRRAMGNLLGHAVRFGAAADILAVGEGIETMLSLRLALPAMAMSAALSAGHLAALELPLTLRRLYIARDADAAGDMALAALTERAAAAGIEVLALSPRRGDFNDDLQAFGPRELRAALRPQIASQDVMRFIPEVAATAG
jgi:hypothetical protein